MIDTTTSDSVLARLEALTARLDEQAGQLQAQAVEIAELRAENARLTATLTTPAVVAPAPVPVTTNRRGMLRGVLSASAAAALLLVAEEATTAKANSRTTVLAGAGSTSNYGIAAVESALDPALNMPPLGTTTHGVLGVFSAGGPSPTRSAAVTGLGSTSGGILGVQGLSNDVEGVYGQSRDNAGVHGKSISNAGVFAQGPIGVYAAGTGLAGVFGGSSGGFGFWGNSATSAGIYGTSTTGPGVRAESTNQFGLHARGPTWAGVFEGNVFVTGRVTAMGGFGVSAAATATTRTLPEDVGEATLANGKATVALAEDFADAANGDYRVFLTELADLGGLYVARKGPKEFEVRSRGGAEQVAASGRFDYRVVAKTAGANSPRQAPLAPPDLTTVKPAPPLPEPPKAPEPGVSDGRRER